MAGISSRALKANYAENKFKYNGIEQNNDFDLNMYDAFYRNHDPQIGRFWQVDPKPTYEFSQYASMNNNPVRFSDPLGDTIVIRYISEGKTVESVYQDGTFFKRDGTNLSKDDNGYASKVFADLLQLDQLGDKEISKRIDELQESKNIHFIQMPAPGDFNDNEPPDAASKVKDMEGVPTGTTTSYNPDNKEDKNGNKRDPIVGLAHELLGHAYDTDKGKTDRGENKKVKNYELSAVNIENRVRAKIGEEKRTTYGQRAIPFHLLHDTHSNIPRKFINPKIR